MAGVLGQWALDVTLGGRTLPFTTSNVNSLAIISNIHQYLPQFTMNFKDDRSLVNGDLGSIGDGQPVKVSIGNPDYHVYEDRAFKISGSPDVAPSTSYSNLGFGAFLDKSDWTRKVVNKVYSGPTSSVISQIAREVGFDVDVDTTSDEMDWLPNNKILAQFANHVADRGFGSAKSIMMLAVSDSGLLRYADVEKRSKNSPTRTFASRRGDGDVQILSYKAEPKSVASNAAQGYGSTSTGMKPDGTLFELNKIATTLLSGRLSIGDAISIVDSASSAFAGGAGNVASSISNALGEAAGDLGRRIEQFVPLAGNTHEKWYEAQHQNRRGRSLFAYDVSIISHIPLQVDLLDLVRLVPLNPHTGKIESGLVGNYFVSSTTKFLSGNGFYEKAVLTSQGTS